MPNPITTILVGCGGSGAKTACELSDLMSQDPQWRHEMDECVYFLLIDTDQGDLDRYASRLRKSAPGVYVASLLSSEGFGTVGEILAEFVPGLEHGDEEEKRKAFERFAGHWWFEHPAHPTYESAHAFRAPNVARITAGAGQVPMVSHLAAWHAMKASAKTVNSIEDTIRKLCEVIANRRAGIDFSGGDPLAEFNIFFIGSVAGGTGRGCVIPVAFKFKEVFVSRFKRVPYVSGYLLDQACFEVGRDHHEGLPQMMNAMTGWSEVSAWFTAFREGMEKAYSLPGTRRIADTAFDVLRSPLEGIAANQAQEALRRDRARLPFDAMGVIGRVSGAGFAANRPEEIYQMVAAGLYCRLTQSTIDSRISNDGRTYFSIGSSVAEIPCHEIQTYFDDVAAYESAVAIQRDLPLEETQAEARRIMECLGFGDPLGDLLGEAEEEAPNSALGLLTREWFSSGEQGDSDVNRLAIALESQDLHEVYEQLGETLSPSRLEDPRFVAKVGDAYLEQLETHLRRQGVECAGAEGVLALVIDLIAGSREDSVLQRHQSVVAAAETAKLVEMGLGEIFQKRFSKEAIDSWYQETGLVRAPEIEAVIDETKGREGFLGMFGPRFSEQEMVRLKQEARKELRRLYAQALGVWGGDAQGGVLAKMRPELLRLRKNANLISAAADQCLAESGLTKPELEDRAEALFSPADLAQGLGMSNRDAADYHIRRTIRPARPSEADLKLVNPATLAQVRRRLLGDALEGEISDHPQLRSELASAFREARLLFHDQGPGERIIERFELAPCLRDLHKRWRRFLKQERTKGEDHYRDVEQKFRNYFGIDPRVVGDEIDLSGGQAFESVGGSDSLLLGLACAAARTCRPFWKASPSDATQPRLIVQVPLPLEGNRRQQWAAEVQSRANIAGAGQGAVDIIANAEDTQRHNPFVLVVYMSEGASSLDEVDSLDAWHRDEQLQSCLRMAESREIPMPFRGDEMWQGYRGSGFADPCYVFDPVLRRCRWRPWLPAAERERELSEGAGSALDLVTVYASWGPRWFLEAVLGPEDAQQALADSGLPGEPLLAEGERRMFKLGRLPCRIAENGTAATNPASIHIGVGDSFTQSIHTVPEVLAGRREARSRRNAAPEQMVALREAVESEYEGFFGPMAREYGFHQENGQVSFRRLLDAMQERALHERQASSPGGDGGDYAFWQSVLDRIEAQRRYLLG